MAAVLLVILDRLIFMALGVILCIGIIFGCVIGMLTSSKEMRSWINDDDCESIVDAWMSINHVAKWIPGYAIGRMIGIKLGRALDEIADL